MGMRKVEELEGALLDYWVARAEGLDVVLASGMAQTLRRRDGEHLTYGEYGPSVKWSEGGPIIERKHIWLSDEDGKWVASLPPHVDVRSGHDLIQFGSWALQAAMRAYVASEFGPEVPDVEESK